MPTQNELTKNYSGIFGNKVVLKNRNGKSIMTIPLQKGIKGPSDKQVDARLLFKQATEYGNDVLEDPVELAAYAAKPRKGLNPYLMAVTDFLTPPVVRQIDTSAYRGNPGDTIDVVAIDDFAVAGVTVKKTDSSGALIE